VDSSGLQTGTRTSSAYGPLLRARAAWAPGVYTAANSILDLPRIRHTRLPEILAFQQKVLKKPQKKRLSINRARRDVHLIFWLIAPNVYFRKL